jgi:hypothetical protein
VLKELFQAEMKKEIEWKKIRAEYLIIYDTIQRCSICIIGIPGKNNNKIQKKYLKQ